MLRENLVAGDGGEGGRNAKEKKERKKNLVEWSIVLSIGLLMMSRPMTGE